MKTSLHWCDKWTPEVGLRRHATTTKHHVGNGAKRRVSTIHVCMAAIALAFVGGVAVGINGWLPVSGSEQRTSWPKSSMEVLNDDDVSIASPSSNRLDASSLPAGMPRGSSRRGLRQFMFQPWNVSSGRPPSHKQDGDVQRNDASSSSSSRSTTDLLRLLRRAMMTRRLVADLTLPIAKISHKRQEVPGGRERDEQAQEWGGGVVVRSSAGAVTQRLVPVTAGLPQITRSYPLGLPSSRPESRSHDGVPTTILVDYPSPPRPPPPPPPSSPSHHQQHLKIMAAAEREQEELAYDPSATNANMSETTIEAKQNGGQNVTANDLVDGIYWSERVESMLPTGFNQQDVASWTEFSGNATVVKVLEGCGRMQNRMLVFDNGTRSCCRYRQNNDQIQGEIFSFYLAKLLGIENLPPASLGLLYGREWQWTSVRGQLTLAQWNEQKPVVMTKFIDGLELAYIPRHFRGEGLVLNEEAPPSRRLHPVTEDLAGLTDEQVVELAQWSDLIVFDYLTANLDRVVNNMYNRQWNPDMMVAPAHNLAKETSSGLLVFLDNESGLLHGYRLLDKYESYHRAMLQSLCVFRARTVRAIHGLLESGDIGARLRRTLHESQPYMIEWLPPLPDKSVKILRHRLEAVYKQVTLCERRYSAAVSDVDATVERYDSPVTPDTL